MSVVPRWSAGPPRDLELRLASRPGPLGAADAARSSVSQRLFPVGTAVLEWERPLWTFALLCPLECGSRLALRSLRRVFKFFSPFLPFFLLLLSSLPLPSSQDVRGLEFVAALFSARDMLTAA